MKTTKLMLALASTALLTWSCNSGLSDSALKSSLQSNAASLSSALNNITQSEGYQVLTNNSTASSSASKVTSLSVDSTFNSILLGDIKGEYDFNRSSTYKHIKPSVTQFFTKVAENADYMIVRLPKLKVQKPYLLFSTVASDTLLTNNYVFTLSKYDYRFKSQVGWTYEMASNINVDSVSAGDLSIQSSNDYAGAYKFASQYNFADGYNIATDYVSGDTAIAVYSVKKDNSVLYEEKYTAVKSSSYGRHREREYALTIGNVQIVRNLGKNSLDSAKVYVGGVLQTTAKVEVVDLTTTDGTDVSVTSKKRELKITFDDGTSQTISELLGTSVETIRNLFISLRQSYFATDIVDRIAWDIYKNK